MATPCYYLNVTIRAYDAEVFLNGAPIERAHRGFPRFAQLPVSEWLVQGENRLSVTILGADHLPQPEPPREGDEASEADGEGVALAPVAPPPAAAAAAASEDEPLLRVALCVGDLGELVEPGQDRELLVLEWTPPPPPAEDEPPFLLPHEVEEHIALSHPWGSWSWEAAPVLDLLEDPAIVLEASDFVAELHAAMVAGRLDAVIDRSAPKFDEVAPCYDFDPADARGRLPLAWPEISASPDFRLADFDPSDLELRPCCGGRVLEPRTLAGEPVIRQAVPIDDSLWAMPLFLARVDGRLTVVR
ncbi:MAG: hypothetical protein KF729_28280 [Sandaracinaceae bacterium]|nr:hypothetical protein [Sandaracinaceae bacterium]